MGLHKTNWDIEAELYELECAIDMLDRISDGLPDDRVTTNALNGLYGMLSNVHTVLKKRLLVE